MVELARSERFDMGLAVRQTFGVIGRNFAPIAFVALVVGILIFALSYGSGMIVGFLQLPYGSRIGSILGGLIGLVLQPLPVAVITQIAINDLAGRTGGLGTAAQTGLRLLFPLLMLGLVSGIAIVLGFILVIVPGLMLAIRWLVATPVRVAEGPSVRRALSRSAELTSGSRWRLLGLFIAYLVLVLLVQWGFTLLVGNLTSGLGPQARTLVGAGSNILLGTVQSVISATGTAVCYVQLRQLREGATPNQLAAVFA